MTVLRHRQYRNSSLSPGDCTIVASAAPARRAGDTERFVRDGHEVGTRALAEILAFVGIVLRVEAPPRARESSDQLAVAQHRAEPRVVGLPHRRRRREERRLLVSLGIAPKERAP